MYWKKMMPTPAVLEQVDTFVGSGSQLQVANDTLHVHVSGAAYVQYVLLVKYISPRLQTYP